jgi:hypothetical protein
MYITYISGAVLLMCCIDILITRELSYIQLCIIILTFTLREKKLSNIFAEMF